MASRVFSQRPQQLPACGRRWRSFGLGEKTLEIWERQRQKPFVRKCRLIRSMFSLGKSNVCVDNFWTDAPPARWCVGRQQWRRATTATSNGSLEATKTETKGETRFSQTGLFTSEDRTKTRQSILPTSLPTWCGWSLYRLLFRSCTYHQADLAGEPNLHFEHSAASLLPRELKDNDFVLLLRF